MPFNPTATKMRATRLHAEEKTAPPPTETTRKKIKILITRKFNAYNFTRNEIPNQNGNLQNNDEN